MLLASEVWIPRFLWVVCGSSFGIGSHVVLGVSGLHESGWWGCGLHLCDVSVDLWLQLWGLVVCGVCELILCSVYTHSVPALWIVCSALSDKSQQTCLRAHEPVPTGVRPVGQVGVQGV